MAGSQIMTPPFESKETLFYKSVRRVAALFVFLPSAPGCGRNRKVTQSTYSYFSRVSITFGEAGLPEVPH
jgi:hypothetical protein